MEFWKVNQKRSEKKYLVVGKYRGPSTIALLFLSIALFSWIFAFGISVVPIALWIYNTTQPKVASQLAQSLRDVKFDYTKAIRPHLTQIIPSPLPGDVGESPSPTLAPSILIPDKVLPPQDSSLSPFPSIKIPSIEVDASIWEATYENFEDALRRGVWRVPEFGDPTTSKTSPMILVAHRYGYLEWTTEFRRTNSFYNLPNVKEGDIVEIAWDMRPFKYQIVKIEEGIEITDYSHPLIMYTCKYLVSDKRIFVYADLVE